MQNNYYAYSRVKKFALNLLLTSLLSFCFAWSLSTAFNLNYRWLYVFAPCVVMCVLVMVFFDNPIIFRALYSLFFIAVIVVASIWAVYALNQKIEFINTAILQMQQFADSAYETAMDFIAWLITYIDGVAVRNKNYEHVVLMFFIFCGAIVSYTFAVRYFNFYMLAICGLTLFISQWLLGYVKDYSSFAIFIVVMVTLWFLNSYRNHYKRYGGDAVAPYTFVWLVTPVSLLLTLLAFNIPAPEHPVAFNFVTVNAQRVADFFSDFFHMSNASNNQPKSVFTAVADSVLLGGDMTGGSGQILRVNSSYPLYLRASVYDVYSGDSWQRTQRYGQILYPGVQYEPDAPYNIGGMLDPPLLRDDSAYQSTQLPEYFYNEISADVTFLNHSSSVIYVTGDTREIRMDSDGAAVTFTDAKEIRASKAFGKDFRYQLTMRRFDFSDPDAVNSLAQSYRGYMSDFIENWRQDEQLQQLYDAYMLKQLDSYSEHQYEYYTQLPPELPQRVRDLAQQITQDFDSDYEKVAAIESYLSQNYTYTKRPGNYPSDSDFVDYFLFESKQGYCAFYATAMTVMVRCIGLPARYVSGYIYQPQYNGIVTGDQAHAWTEVYFEGADWMSFEPTSPFNSVLYGISSSAWDGYNNYDSYQESYSSNVYDMMLQNTDGDAPDLQSETQGMPLVSRLSRTFIVTVSIALLVLALAGVILFNVISRRWRYRRIKRQEPRMAVISCYYYYLELLKLVKMSIGQDETAREFESRVSPYIALAPVDFKQATDMFESARYGGVAVPQSDKDKMMSMHGALMSEIRLRLGELKYHAYAYLLHKM